MIATTFIINILLLISWAPKAQTLESPWPVEAKDYKKIVLESIESEVVKTNGPEDPTFHSSAPVAKEKSSPMNKGQLRVQEILKKKRQALKLRKAQANPTWLQEKVKKQKRWIKNNKDAKAKWVKRKLEILNKWKKDKDSFNKSIPTIKKYLIPAKQLEPIESSQSDGDPSFGSSLKSNRINQKKISIIDQTFEIPIKHQGNRATCAAFSAIRSLEIDILRQEKKLVNLSEEFFFYLSRPDCHKAQCETDGSWPRLAFKQLIKNKGKASIPLESQCPYIYPSTPKNIFHLPLKKGCSKGNRQITSFVQIERNLDISTLPKQQSSLVMGFYVEDHFIENNGLVYKRPHHKKTNKAFAHTVLIVGVIPLPKINHESIGAYCLLSVNSWGTGWGIGGYACLGEKWVKKHRVPNKPLYAII